MDLFMYINKSINVHRLFNPCFFFSFSKPASGHEKPHKQNSATHKKWLPRMLSVFQ